jgi:hypothetical protein
LQVSRAADPETLQSQLAKTARKRLSLSGLELLHGRLNKSGAGNADSPSGGRTMQITRREFLRRPTQPRSKRSRTIRYPERMFGSSYSGAAAHIPAINKMNPRANERSSG